jgi:hypothetical protein
MRVAAHGIAAELPDRWEGAIRAEREDALSAAAADHRVYPVAHLSSFGLPGRRGDFGSGAVEAMGRDDDFVALVEFGEAEVDSNLFASKGLPRRLDPRRFSPRSLQRMLPGQTGMQHFFTVGGRAFCLYVVLGDRDDAHLHVRRVERVLAGLTIQDRA